MPEMKIYCMCLHDHHLNNLKKLNYIPVGLGKNIFLVTGLEIIQK